MTPSATTLRERLVRVSLATLGVALAVVVLVVILSSFAVNLRTLIGDSRAQAELLAGHAGATLLFQDAAAARELLGSLEHVPAVCGAAIHQKDHTRFASYQTTGHPLAGEGEATGENTGMRLVWDLRHLQFNQPIVHNGETLGNLTLLVALAPLYQQALTVLLLSIPAGLIILFLAQWALGRISRALLQPLLDLTALMDRVSTHSDYTARARPTDLLELDALAYGFNDMLAQIQERDTHLAEHRAHLETEVDNRTRELRRALEAETAARLASQAKSAFLATMSHEIRTPMNGVLGMTEMLLNTRLAPEQQRFAEAAQRSGRHLMNLINDVLDFSKIESRQMHLETLDFELGQLLEETVSMFARPAEEKGLLLAVDLVALGTPLALRGDPHRLRQVLVNLLGNAIKFTERGEVVLRLPPPDLEATQVHFRLEVRDTGIGIAAEDQARVFDHFAQADGSTTRRFGGSGLGLAISRSLVELMGGKLSLESAPEHGAIFRVDLILPRAAAAPPMPNLAELSGLRVLLRETHPTQREILRRQLEAWGLLPTCLEDPDEALSWLTQEAQRGHAMPLGACRTLGSDSEKWTGAVGFQPETPKSDRLLALLDDPDLAARIRQHPDLATTRLVLTHADAGATPASGAILHRPLLASELYETLCNTLRDALTETAQPMAPAAPPPPPVHLRGRVLLVEDNPDNQELAKAVLDFLGLEVEQAVNGQEAVEQVGRNPYDLVLMDCQMPVMDGYQATARIRENLAGAPGHLPIVALTANATEADRDKCLAAGMDDYLPKPFTLTQLQQTLSHWLAAADPAPVVLPEETAAPVGDIDPKRLEELREIDPQHSLGLAIKLVRAFLEQAEGVFGQLEQSLAAGDAEIARRSAHNMKSSAANVGAMAYAQLLREIEHLARDQNLDAARDALRLLRPTRARALAALRTWLEAVS
jgi:signal transduction histidine kinase/CheY-like chemotaxis protein/HPt (histidine-containing phosphotransfer) domain-containing protein